jgi:hypothetical protein
MLATKAEATLESLTILNLLAVQLFVQQRAYVSTLPCTMYFKQSTIPGLRAPAGPGSASLSGTASRAGRLHQSSLFRFCHLPWCGALRSAG